MKKITTILFLILFLSITAFAHSGGTDSKGGHFNHSTGQYHYHHGREAHQHPNGICELIEKDRKETRNNIIISTLIVLACGITTIFIIKHKKR
jgi:hypothetical protein